MRSAKILGLASVVIVVASLVVLDARQEVRADDPPVPLIEEGVIVVLDEGAVNPDLEPDDATLIVSDPMEYAAAVEYYASMDLLTGDAVIVHVPDQVIGPISPVPVKVQAWATVYDQGTLDMWGSTSFVPAFLAGVEVTEIPPVSEAVFDLDIMAPDADGIVHHVKIRVRNGDGAAAVVFSDPTASIMSLEQVESRCDAGPWWRRGRICCHVQRLNCTIVRYLLGPVAGPAVCGNCEDCFDNCMTCAVRDPCHSCDPCGLSFILCRWFGHC